MRLLAAVLTIAACLVCAQTASGDAEVQGLDDLIARIPSTAVGGGVSIGKEEEELAARIRRYGNEAVPRMIELLSSNDDQIRFFAGYVLRGLDGLNEEHLNALILARKRGDGWIPPAIARIGTPRAIDFLIQDLRDKPEDHTQVTWALAQAGSKSAVPLAAVFEDEQPLSEDVQRVVRHVFSEMGAPAEAAVPVLLQAANSPRLPVENRRGAILALGAIGSPAAAAVPRLKKLAERSPEMFSAAVDNAIVGTGSPDAADVIAARLRSRPDVVLLRDLAAIGPNGKEAGPTVEDLLGSSDWQLRVAAARTLGYIQYGHAEAALRHALHDTADWRLVLCSAESLGRLRAKGAIPDLEWAIRTHWFRPVRAAAQKAIRVIAGKENYERRADPRSFAFEFFDYQHAGEEQAATDDHSATPSFVPEPAVLSTEELKRLSYEVNEPRHEPSTPRKLAPGCGLRIRGGYLLGADRGEWGGELVFVDEQGHPTLLFDGNVEGIHETSFGIVVTSGLAHMLLNSGYLYLVDLTDGAIPKARRWKALPGAPRESGLLQNGNLFVACFGGNVIITAGGEIEMAAD